MRSFHGARKRRVQGKNERESGTYLRISEYFELIVNALTDVCSLRAKSSLFFLGLINRVNTLMR